MTNQAIVTDVRSPSDVEAAAPLVTVCTEDGSHVDAQDATCIAARSS